MPDRTGSELIATRYPVGSGHGGCRSPCGTLTPTIGERASPLIVLRTELDEPENRRPLLISGISERLAKCGSL
jgi:hypothetical protein